MEIVLKLSSVGSGPPAREPLMGEQERKHLMLAEHRRREEVKRLQQDGEETYLNQDWANSSNLRNSLQGVNTVSWKPRL